MTRYRLLAVTNVFSKLSALHTEMLALIAIYVYIQQDKVKESAHIIFLLRLLYVGLNVEKYLLIRTLYLSF